MIELKKEYPALEEFEADYESNIKASALLLSSSTRPEARSSARVTLSISGKDIGTVEGEVVYSGPAEGGFNVGLQLVTIQPDLLARAKEFVHATDGKKIWGKDSESLYHEIENMDTHKKIQVALKGGREERRLLMKSQHHAVFAYLLKNPRITLDEVASFAKMPAISGEMIQTIVSNTEWMNSDQIRLAIVKNPKTPIPVVQKHISKLRDQDLITLAKSENVRDGVSKAAMRVLSGRGKSIMKR